MNPSTPSGQELDSAQLLKSSLISLTMFSFAVTRAGIALVPYATLGRNKAV